MRNRDYADVKFSELPLPWIITGIPTYIRLKRMYPSIEAATREYHLALQRAFWYENPHLITNHFPDLPHFDMATQDTAIINPYGIETIRRRSASPIPKAVQELQPVPVLTQQRV